jgi:CHAT domain-containing protein
VLVVGVPSFAAELFPGLDPLPGAAAEARDVAGRYRRAELVEGAAATRARILDALPGASAFHFAGHSRSVEGPAARSSLVLGGAPGGLAENVLFGDEIERLDLGSLRLVVLSACGSSVRGRSAGTAVSLERAFLAAGADAVVSSLWEIDDASTGLLMAAFHDAAAAGLTAAASLQAAQVEAIRREEAGGTDRRQGARFRVERR